MSLLSKNVTEQLLKTTYPINLPKVGDFVSGTVIEKKGTNVFVDLGEYKTGIIYGKEFYDARDMVEGLKIGDELTAKVVEPENENGFVELSLKEAGMRKVWEEFDKKKSAGEVLTVRVRQANKGGLVAEIQGVQAFLPVSQLAFHHYPRVENGDKGKIMQELNKFVNKELQVRIIDVNPNENKLIVSEKEITSDDIKKVLLAYKVGDIIEGEVGGVMDFGAFVKFSPTPEDLNKIEGGGAFLDKPPVIEGLIHISELDWQLVDNPRNFVKIGDKVTAKVVGIEGNKISLSLKALKPDPWLNIAEKFKKDDVVKGAVTKINHFGAFVKLTGTEIQGLCHISDFGKVDKVKELLSVGKEYDFKISSIDSEHHKMALELVREKVHPAGDDPKGQNPAPKLAGRQENQKDNQKEEKAAEEEKEDKEENIQEEKQEEKKEEVKTGNEEEKLVQKESLEESKKEEKSEE